MLKITYLLLLINVLVSFSSFAQERKIEKNVYSNFKEGKLDLALFELENMRDKYGDKSFFHYWKAYIYTEKINRLKTSTWIESNRDSARIFLDSSLFLLYNARKKLTSEELTIDKEEFDILFPGCTILLPSGEKKYTNTFGQFTVLFEDKKEMLNKLKYNFNLESIMSIYKKGPEDIDDFLKEIKPRVKTIASLNPLDGEVSVKSYMELANVRNQKVFKVLQKETSDQKWINYLKNYTEEEYLSIVPNLEKLINDFYFAKLENFYITHESNIEGLVWLNSSTQQDKSSLENNTLKYIQSKYGTVTFSNSFFEERKNNYDKLINKTKDKIEELTIKLMGVESQNIINKPLSEDYEELQEQIEACDNFLTKYTKYIENPSYLAIQKTKEELIKQKEDIVNKPIQLLAFHANDVSNEEWIKAFGITTEELGENFVNENSSEIKPTFEIIAKQFYRLEGSDWILIAMGVNNPNDSHAGSGTTYLALLKYNGKQWLRIQMMDAAIGNSYGLPGVFEGIHLFGKKNIAISLQTGYGGMGISTSSRTLFGIIENEITDIYSADIYYYDMNNGEIEDNETKISFVKSSDAFYKLKEVKYSHNKAIKTKLLTFNTITKKYL
jgi:hypothetical protein